MIITSQPSKPPSRKLLIYLKSHYGISDSAIELGLKKSKEENAPLPIILWSYGIISVTDYQNLLDWLDQS
ncbi:DUF2949 domain-containing protein [Prochlorococcus marinus]|uniref:DUF2949 domain-containing protein n=1 Tax=Prochlorococcus marinus TaxID=1219 RepID=UPI00006725E8|nr:DUF2949 domain-containing protein [Prochlorococcus marinus]